MWGPRLGAYVGCPWGSSPVCDSGGSMKWAPRDPRGVTRAAVETQSL